jgi:cellulose synthase/poly-beta-1,6-N-acetylglucosamine synthase-like glycosyltransferase
MIALSENIYKIYICLLIVIGLYSLHKVSIVWRFYKHRDNVPQPQAYYSDWELPPVTIQLPIFNEINVVERLLEAIAHIHYPQEKLEIQVLDDSLDETQTLCQSKVEELQNRGLNIHYIRRHHRTGFKAGALEHGLKSASGELVMIFDADFVPEPDTLLKMVHYFSDPKLGMVQARWGHINRYYFCDRANGP